MKKRILSVLLTACLVLTLLPTAARAAANPSASIEDSSLYFQVSGSDLQYSTDNSTWTTYTGTFTITGDSATNTVIVSSGTHAITLSGCSIGAESADGSYVSTGLSPFNIQGGTVNLTLSGENKLYSAHYNYAGLRVNAGAALTISGTGSLDARCQKNDSPTHFGKGAGIGGNSGEGSGRITISGGAVSAYSLNGAGIGGGYNPTSNFDDIAIFGGTVYAQSDWGCGIGYGKGGSTKTGTVTITGGSVCAFLNQGSNSNPKIGGTVQNANSVNVELYTLTLPEGNANTLVTSLTTTEALGYSYGTSGMKTDSDGKLYVYLPASKTAVSVTTDSGTYAGAISSNAATLIQLYAVSGTVNAGTTGIASVSGLTVNLYASTDITFASSVGSAITNGSGAYTISGVPNGSYVARVAGVAGSFGDSTTAFTVNNAAKTGVDITLARAAYTGANATVPTLASKTDTQVVLNSVTVAGQTVEYGKNTSDATPSAWQDSTTFDELQANTLYYFFARVKQAGAVEAGGMSTALSVTTKNAAPVAPSRSFSGITENSVTINAVTGAEYSKDNGASWQDSNAFTDLSAATQYAFAIRIKETDETVAGAATSQARYTAAATPAAGVGYTINYSAETIGITTGYEVSAGASFGTAIANNAALTPGGTYCVRVTANGDVPASAEVIFTTSTRPSAPIAVAEGDITQTDTTITITSTVSTQQYSVNGGTNWQTGNGGNLTFSGLTAGQGYSVVTRIAATGTSFASPNSTDLPVITKTAPAAAPTSGVTYSVKNGTITGLGDTYEYSLDGGSTWQAAPDTGISFAAGNSIQVRTMGSGTAMPSLPQTLGTIATAAAAPTYAIDYAGERTSAAVPATTEYNTTAADAAASAWTTGTDEVLALTPGTTYYFRVAATDAALAGNVQTLVVPARPSAPADTVVTIAVGDDASHTSLTLAASYEYILADALPAASASGTAGTGSAIDVAATAGQKVYVRQKAVANTSFASDWTDCGAVVLGIDSIAFTGVGYDVAAGTLTGTTTEMEYSLDGGSTWEACAAGNTTGLSFAAGTVKVRQKDKTTNEHTVATLATAVVSSAPTLVSKTYNSVTLTAVPNYEYSKDNGASWQDSNVFPGLNGNTAYSFVARIKATATTLPGTVSDALPVTTDNVPSGGGSSSPSTGAPVIVDGKTENIGTEKKSGDTTTVTVDQSKLGTNISGAASGSSVIVPVSENGTATASLVVKSLQDMAAKAMTLTVQTGNVAYNLDAAAIDTAAISAAFPGADMSKVPFNVTIQNSSASVEGETLVLAAVTFTVTATYNGQTVSVDIFSAYIDRVIEVTAEQAAKITTAVVVNADGSTRHVPTNVITKDGKYYAIINSRTNSTYALIQNEVTFVDAKGKWFEAAVNEMGSRKIIAGRSASVFDGGASITRAEFSAILVRALGLPADGTSSFSDVPASAWYAGAVATAAQYGIVSGKGDSRFDPNAKITRQEAMLMLQRAAALTAFAGTSVSLDGFADADSVGSWAKDAARWSVGSGLIQGADGKLTPTANITRAESAAVILRLLQKAQLVDVRN